MTRKKTTFAGTCLIACGIAVGSILMLPPAPSTALPITSAICSSPTSSSHVIRVSETAKLNDGEIAYIYIQENLFEVETAKLGLERGTAPEVKAHGKMVAKDHTGVVKMFEKLLKTTGVKPTAPPNSQERLEQHQKNLAALKTKSGKAFDRAYVDHELANHRAVIKALRDVLIPTVENSALREHFRAMLPAFEHHLATTVEAAKKLGSG